MSFGELMIAIPLWGMFAMALFFVIVVIKEDDEDDREDKRKEDMKTPRIETDPEEIGKLIERENRKKEVEE